jgi:hypothetical protein
MAAKSYPFMGQVAVLLSDEELIINRGSANGLIKDMIFSVLDARAQNVPDPQTGESLGSIEVVKVRVRLTRVEEKLSIAELVSPRSTLLSDAVRAVAGGRPSRRLTADTWPEGVAVGDPVVSNGEMWTPPSKR